MKGKRTVSTKTIVTLEFKSAEEAYEALKKITGNAIEIKEADAEPEVSTHRASDIKEKAEKKSAKKAPKKEEIEEDFLDEEDEVASDDPADFEEDEMEMSDIEDEDDDFEEEEEKPKAKKGKPAKKSEAKEDSAPSTEECIKATAAYVLRLAKKHGEDKAQAQALKILKSFGAKSPRGLAQKDRQAFLDRLAPKKA